MVRNSLESVPAPVAITIRTGEDGPVPAQSMLSVLSLGAKCGTKVTITAEGAGAQEALDALAEFLVQDLDAEAADA